MNRYIKLFLICITLMVYSTGCNEFLDVNTDPLAATRDQVGPNSGLLFPRIQAELAAERILESGNVLFFWSQGTASAGSAGTVFTNPENYTVPSFPQIVSWDTYYVTQLRNIAFGIEFANENNQPNISAVFQIARAFVFYHITSSWENVPYTQALDNAITEPEFDDQETILRGLIEDLNTAIATFDATNPTTLTGEDLIYGGNSSNWIRFANSLKLKILMMIVNRDPSVAGQIADLVQNQPLVDANEFNAFVPFGTDITNANQLWKLHNQFAGGNSNFFNATTTIVDLMDGDGDGTGVGAGAGTPGDDDPRLTVYFDLPTPQTDPPTNVINGAPAGSSVNLARLGDLSLNFLRPEQPDVWMSASEINLIKAEAVSRGFAAGDADALYRLGVRNSLEFLNGVFVGNENTFVNVDDMITPLTDYNNSIDIFVNNLPAATTQNIIEQQYIALFMRGFESYTNIRRTGLINSFDLPANSVLGSHAKRLPYSTDGAAANPNTPSNPPLDQDMWFEAQ